MLRHCSLHKTRLTHYSLSTAPAYVMPVLLTSAYIRKSVSVTSGEAVYAGSLQHRARRLERHCQRGSHIQRKNSGINLHERGSLWPASAWMTFRGWRWWACAWYSCAGRCVVWPESKSYSVSFGPSDSLLQPVAHGFVVTAHNGSRRRGRVVIIQLSTAWHSLYPSAEPGGLHLLAGSASRTHFFGQDPHKRSYTIQSNDSGVSIRASPIRIPVFQRWRTAYGDADPAYRKEGHSLRGQQVGRCGPRGSGHSSQGDAVAKSTPGAMGNRETRSGESAGECCSWVIFHVAHALFMDQVFWPERPDPSTTINRSTRIFCLLITHYCG